MCGCLFFYRKCQEKDADIFFPVPSRKINKTFPPSPPPSPPGGTFPPLAGSLSGRQWVEPPLLAAQGLTLIKTGLASSSLSLSLSLSLSPLILLTEKTDGRMDLGCGVGWHGGMQEEGMATMYVLYSR